MVLGIWNFLHMENKNNNHNGNSSGNGFLLGVIVGVLLTLLFTTKRGRAIFKEVMEKGIERFSNLEELMRESYETDVDEELYEEGDDFIPAKPVAITEPPKENKESEKKAEEIHTEHKPAVKETAAPKTIKTEPEPQAPEKKEEKPSARNASHSDASGKAPHGKRWFRGLRKKS